MDCFFACHDFVHSDYVNFEIKKMTVFKGSLRSLS